MTTIVYRAGVMAADSRAYAGSNRPLGQKAKIRRLKGGTLIGCSSNQPGVCEAVMDWFAAGANPAAVPPVDAPGFALLVVRPDGRAFYGDDRFVLSGPLEAEFFAIGSGADFAHGALRMGADAELAVEIACECDAWSAPPILTLTHKG